MDIPDTPSESDIQLRITRFPSGNRDFCLFRGGADGKPLPINPLELLGLDRAAGLIEQEAQQNPPKAMNLALCRLLVPSLQTSHIGRHLIIDQWSESVVRGETLAEETRTHLASELSQEQAEKWRLVTTGQEVPKGTLAELLWDAVTNLPSLPRQFDDPDLGKFGKAFYFHLIPPGKGRAEIEWSDATKEIQRCRAEDFAPLGLPFSGRELRRLYRKYMAVTVRWVSKMTGRLARELIDERRGDASPLTPNELVMHDLRYGASEIFGKINVGFLFGCGPLFASFFNDIFRSVASGAAEAQRNRAADELLRFVYLQRAYLTYQQYAWRDAKADLREHYRDPMPDGRHRKPAERHIDVGARSGAEHAIISEEMLLLREQILPELQKRKPAYANLLRLFIDNNGNFEAAAMAADMPPRTFARHLKETVFPAAQRIARRMKFSDLLES